MSFPASPMASKWPPRGLRRCRRSRHLARREHRVCTPADGGWDSHRTACRSRPPPWLRNGRPEAYVDVGDLDILRDENIVYARRLMAAGIPTELHVVPGLPHGFEMAAPDAAATQRIVATRLRRLKLL